jgi:cell division protease FtsH
MYQSRWGFSDELGTVIYGDNNQDEVFLGYSIGRQQTVPEATAQKIDAEVRRLMEPGLAEATKIITEKRQDLEILAKGLLEYETLTGEEIVNLIKGRLPVAGYRRRSRTDAWLSCPHHRRCSSQTRP